MTSIKRFVVQTTLRVLQLVLENQRDKVPFLAKQFLLNLPNVTFLQIGANDGKTGDLLYECKRQKKWQGVMLEPQSMVFQVLQENFPEDRYILLNAAMSHVSGSATLFKIKDSESRWANGLASFKRESILAHFENGYIGGKLKEEGISLEEVKNYSDCIVEEEVQTISFPELVRRAYFPAYDALLIDVEGFDFEVLKMVELGDPTLQFVIFEFKHLSQSDRKSAEDLLKKHDFITISGWSDTIGIRGASYLQWSILLKGLFQQFTKGVKWGEFSQSQS
ncbi:MAG: FkbM family methyltransferase [Saprospiraceae bacterium]|nr:FkbM family methyltransferase [Saprospiraceae bacterium]